MRPLKRCVGALIASVTQKTPNNLALLQLKDAEAKIAAVEAQLREAEQKVGKDSCYLSNNSLHAPPLKQPMLFMSR